MTYVAPIACGLLLALSIALFVRWYRARREMLARGAAAEAPASWYKTVKDGHGDIAMRLTMHGTQEEREAAEKEPDLIWNRKTRRMVMAKQRKADSAARKRARRAAR